MFRDGLLNTDRNATIQSQSPQQGDRNTLRAFASWTLGLNVVAVRRRQSRRYAANGQSQTAEAASQSTVHVDKSKMQARGCGDSNDLLVHS